jgi:hypothetical protein
MGYSFTTLNAANSGAWAAIPVGVFAANFLLEQVGLRPVFLASRVLYFAAMLALALNPATREMAAPVPQEPQPASGQAA